MLAKEYRPGSHRLQFELLGTGLKLPGGHGKQDGEFPSEKKPGSHTLHVLARLFEKVPDEQARQAVDRLVEKVPATHPRQLIWAGVAVYVPGLHEAQVRELVAPDAVENEPDSQSMQDPDELTAVPVWNVPALHERHWLRLEDARPVEYVPVVQETHLLDRVIPVPVLYVPEGHDSQFSPDQLAGGWSWTPTGKFCHVLFQPPTPVKPALHTHAV